MYIYIFTDISIYIYMRIHRRIYISRIEKGERERERKKKIMNE